MEPLHSIKLANGRPVLAAFIVPGSNIMMENGIVLSETEHDWVTWEIHKEPDHTPWGSGNGHYFTKAYRTDNSEARNMAEFDFGLRLARLLSPQALRGVRP